MLTSRCLIGSWLALFSEESRFVLWQLDRTDTVIAFGGGSVMVRGGFSLHHKTRLIIIGGNLNAECYQDEILQPVAILYLHSLVLNAVLQEYNTCPLIIRDYLQSLGVERMELPTCNSDLNLTETGSISWGVLFVSEWPTRPHWLCKGVPGY